MAAGYAAKAGGPTKLVYYISPQIWASRAKRRFEMARNLDGLASIFPFEKAVYADTDLSVSFVGHPFVEPDYHAPVAFDKDGPVLLLPGSRQGLVKRLMPVMLAAFARSGAGRDAVVLYPSDEIRALVESFDLPPNLTLQRTDASSDPVGASAVLTTSGTMSMHCALAGIPGVVTYKTDPLTYWLGRMIVKVEFIGIANLLLKRAMYPEYIQGAATSDALARELESALADTDRSEQTRRDAADLKALLSSPSEATAANWVARQLAK